jgi:hypothetical protein
VRGPCCAPEPSACFTPHHLRALTATHWCARRGAGARTPRDGPTAGYGPQGDWAAAPALSARGPAPPRPQPPRRAAPHLRPPPRGSPPQQGAQLQLEVEHGLADLDAIVSQLGGAPSAAPPPPPEAEPAGRTATGGGAGGAGGQRRAMGRSSSRRVRGARGAVEAEWTQEEQLRLGEGVGFFCQGARARWRDTVENWPAVARHVGTGRSPQQCAECWVAIQVCVWEGGGGGRGR